MPLLKNAVFMKQRRSRVTFNVCAIKSRGLYGYRRTHRMQWGEIFLSRGILAGDIFALALIFFPRDKWNAYRTGMTFEFDKGDKVISVRYIGMQR